MGNSLDRVEHNRGLFEPNVRDDLRGLVRNGNSSHITDSLVKALELQIITEEIARSRGVEISTDDASAYISENSDYFRDQVDNAIRLFIASVLSREGS